MYGNCKVHKQQLDECPPFLPISLSLQIPAYNLSKFLVPTLNTLTKNLCKIKDSFQFAQKIREQDSTFSMGRLDVDSLFANIPPEETFDTCLSQLFENIDTAEGFTKSEIKQVICLVKRILILYFTVYFTNKLMM